MAAVGLIVDGMPKVKNRCGIHCCSRLTIVSPAVRGDPSSAAVAHRVCAPRVRGSAETQHPGVAIGLGALDPALAIRGSDPPIFL